jgi:hypothetical protein
MYWAISIASPFSNKTEGGSGVILTRFPLAPLPRVAGGCHRAGQSQVFEVALPEDNVFDAPCTGDDLGNVPAGIYSPSGDEGIYVKLNPLKKGNHTLHFHAENPSQNFEDVSYNLTVVPVLSQ